MLNVSKSDEVMDNVVNEIKKLYRSKLLPLEERSQFHQLHSAKLEDVNFEAKPMVLIVGQHSTARTTFIQYLLECEPPAAYLNADPITDHFITLSFDEKERTIPGNALVDDPKHQFRSLASFGNAFLNRFQCSTVNSAFLQNLTIVDTPGILSDENRNNDRGYDFIGVLKWFAERVDRIVILFDSRKLDISEEFRRSIDVLDDYDEKIRIVLNVTDITDHGELMRVYGALMWSLGRVLSSPEVAHVYIGCFGDQSLRFNGDLFEDDGKCLLEDLNSTMRHSTMRQLNDLIKRSRLAKVNAYIMGELKSQMPSFFGKERKKQQLIQNLSEIYDKVQHKHQLPRDSFPELSKMQQRLENVDFNKLLSLKSNLFKAVDEILTVDIGWLLELISTYENRVIVDTISNN